MVELESQKLRALSEMERKTRETVQFIQERILNLQCPRCSMVFGSFSGCFAVTCARYASPTAP